MVDELVVETASEEVSETGIREAEKDMTKGDPDNLEETDAEFENTIESEEVVSEDMPEEEPEPAPELIEAYAEIGKLKEELRILKEEREKLEASYKEEKRHARSEIESQRAELRHLAAELRAASLEKQFLKDHCAELEAQTQKSRKNAKKESYDESQTVEVSLVNEYEIKPGQYGGSTRDNWRDNTHEPSEGEVLNSAEEIPEKGPENKMPQKKSWFSRFTNRKTEKDKK